MSKPREDLAAKVKAWEEWHDSLLADFVGVTDNADDPGRLHSWDWINRHREPPSPMSRDPDAPHTAESAPGQGVGGRLSAADKALIDAYSRAIGDVCSVGWLRIANAPAASAALDVARLALEARLTTPPAFAGAWLPPAGWKLVPEEPTQAMLDDAWRQTGESSVMKSRTDHRHRRFWAAMLAAAPTPDHPATARGDGTGTAEGGADAHR